MVCRILSRWPYLKETNIGKNESQVNVVDNGISMGSCPESDFRTTIKVEDCQDESIKRRSPLVLSTAVDALRQEIQELEEEADHVLDRRFL